MRLSNSKTHANPRTREGKYNFDYGTIMVWVTVRNAGKRNTQYEPQTGDQNEKHAGLSIDRIAKFIDLKLDEVNNDASPWRHRRGSTSVRVESGDIPIGDLTLLIRMQLLFNVKIPKGKERTFSNHLKTIIDAYKAMTP